MPNRAVTFKMLAKLGALCQDSALYRLCAKARVARKLKHAFGTVYVAQVLWQNKLHHHLPLANIPQISLN